MLDGQGGGDTLVGPGGADTFAFTTALGAGNVDVLLKCSAADDTIHLENAAFTGLAAGALAAGGVQHRGRRIASRRTDHLQPATGALYFGPDGSGTGAAVLFATLAAGLTMAAGEFVVI